MSSNANIFNKHQYISLETFRKNGTGVRTPVWFAQDGDTLYVWTDGTSGKAKRIRSSPQVNAAPSDQRGKPLGSYVSGQGSVNLPGSPTFERGKALIDKKYGLLKKLFDLFGRASKGHRVILQIALD